MIMIMIMMTVFSHGFTTFTWHIEATVVAKTASYRSKHSNNIMVAFACRWIITRLTALVLYNQHAALLGLDIFPADCSLRGPGSR